MSSNTATATFNLPAFFAPVVKIPQLDGSVLVKPGQIRAVLDEVSISEFSRQTGISTRHITTLCEQGHLQHRRLTPKFKSKILISRSEVERFRQISDEDIESASRFKPAGTKPPKMPQGVLAAAKGRKTASGAAYPGAKRGGPAPNRNPNPRKT